MVVDNENYDIFIGSNKEYERAVRKKSINVNPDDVNESNGTDTDGAVKKEVKIDDLSRANLTKLDDETLKILRRTRTVSNYETVYMQHKLDFYDSYYNRTDLPEELKAVKRLRRIYRSYRDFLRAISIRDQYIDYLVNKYGGESEFARKMDMGMVRDWIPVVPKLSKKCPDYNLYLSGMMPMDEQELSEDEIKQVQEELTKVADNLDIELRYDVETSIGDIKAYAKMVEEADRQFTGGRSNVSTVSSGDLTSLQNIFKSWYKPDNESNHSKELFYNAPENIRKRFLVEKEYNAPGLLTRIMNGEYVKEPERDPNEMVFDQELGRAIPYKEWLIREDARLFERAGWSKAKLLNYRNVGSKLEQIARKGRPNRKRLRSCQINNSSPGGLYSDILQTCDEDGIESSYVDNGYILGKLEELMRG